MVPMASSGVGGSVGNKERRCEGLKDRVSRKTYYASLERGQYDDGLGSYMRRHVRSIIITTYNLWMTLKR